MMRIPILITVVRLMIHFVNVLTFALILTGGGPNNATQTMGWHGQAGLRRVPAWAKPMRSPSRLPATWC